MQVYVYLHQLYESYAYKSAVNIFNTVEVVVQNLTNGSNIVA
jgi:hypothetical protein